MRKRRTDPPDPAPLLPLSAQAFHVLMALVDKDHHGYGLMREIGERSGGAVTIGAGTLYGCLKRLLAAELIEEVGDRPAPELDDERRRYYRLTPFGARVAAAEARRLESLVREARRKRLLDQSPRRGLRPRPA
jgi:DNA-binding PadR family transcriptional regulator